MKGKQPLNLPSPATRPPLIPGPMAIHQPFPMPASAPVAIPTSIQLPTRDFETSKEDRDGAKRTQAASGSGNPAVKKTRIEEATKCKYVFAKRVFDSLSVYSILIN